ncbi:HEPN domain-containing protein [Candidatus Magnetaquicoccus inordinatus]|uniref:HEPN domain-containing protein n=1 Tax=Candidatus Magnetaquicoccus inordinatus TaxID=2496818 RepID=UPI00102C9871|nr:HEPN domain-containing protein [Candidatus Magnetaquicoccus inordinatus]
MPDHETARRMLEAARRDLQAITNMRDVELFPDEIFGLHAQQAVEKALKAWLAHRDQELPRTHNLRLLLVMLTRSGEDVTGEWDFIDLTAFAVQFRYEAWNATDAHLDRQGLVEQVTTLLTKVTAIVEQGAS